MKHILLFIIEIYKRFFSWTFVPLFGYGCRYSPTCSEYGMQAIEKYGVKKGVTLSIKRIGSCHPYSKRPQLDPLK